MVRLMNRSIDLMEEMALASDNRFLMNRRGYLYATAESGANRRDANERGAGLAATVPVRYEFTRVVPAARTTGRLRPTAGRTNPPART